MMKLPTQAELKRIIGAALATGMKAVRIEVRSDPPFVVEYSTDADAATISRKENPWDQ